MSVIQSLGVKEQIKTILESGGFLRDVETYLKEHFPRIRGISKRSIRRYCRAHGLSRFLVQRLNKK